MKTIDDLFAAWKDAVKRDDVDTIVSLMTEDAEFWSHDTPAMKGRESSRQVMASFLANFSLEQEFDEVERIVEGGWAFVRGVEHNVVTPRAGGAPIEVKQRAFSIIRLDADGSWRFARGMTNRDAPSK
jgi:uncharacterized protein (TIGR02246 family)